MPGFSSAGGGGGSGSPFFIASYCARFAFSSTAAASAEASSSPSRSRQAVLRPDCPEKKLTPRVTAMTPRTEAASTDSVLSPNGSSVLSGVRQAAMPRKLTTATPVRKPNSAPPARSTAGGNA